MSFSAESISLNILRILHHYDNCINYGYIISTIILSIIIYWLFYMPSTWIRNLNDVGYDLAMQKVQSRLKKDAVNRIRRLRRSGELPPPYPNGWYGIYSSLDLKPGKVASVACLGEQFVVYRTAKNQVYVLDAYCPHLGANMGIGGRVVGDNIECPFHQWSFRGSDGICANVPYSSCAPNGTKVRKWISREVSGFIFVWYHADPLESPWELPVEDEIESKNFIYSGHNEFYVNCHIQEIPENGADLSHFNAIHGESILALGGQPKKSIWANFGRHIWSAVWQPMGSPNKHLTALTLTHAIEITPKFHALEITVTGQQVGPAYVRMVLKHPLIGSVIILQTVTPVEPMVQKVVHRFYAPRILAPVIKILIFAESIMFERDVAMWNNKMYLNNPALVKEDNKLKQFRLWYSQFYSADSKTYAEARNNYDW